VTRLASALAVATILIGWVVAQYQYLLPPELTIDVAARGPPTPVALHVALGSIVVVPARAMYQSFQLA
jgi:cytochrome d ubiquinol oxidase subunit II